MFISSPGGSSPDSPPIFFRGVKGFSSRREACITRPWGVKIAVYVGTSGIESKLMTRFGVAFPESLMDGDFVSAVKNRFCRVSAGVGGCFGRGGGTGRVIVPFSTPLLCMAEKLTGRFEFGTAVR